MQQSKWGSSSIEEIYSEVKREDIHQIFFKIEEILDQFLTYFMKFRGVKKGWQMLPSRTQAEPGRKI